ncbi:MAG: hypothetical protein WD250_05025 [Egibacteraceae bacterium]
MSEPVHELPESGSPARSTAPNMRRWKQVLSLLDACDELDVTTAATVLDLTVGWSSATVRLPALQRLAAAGDHAQALRRAQRDPAAHVRRWASTHRRAALLTDRGAPTDTAPAAQQGVTIRALVNDLLAEARRNRAGGRFASQAAAEA